MINVIEALKGNDILWDFYKERLKYYMDALNSQTLAESNAINDVEYLIAAKESGEEYKVQPATKYGINEEGYWKSKVILEGAKAGNKYVKQYLKQEVSND